MKAYRYWSYNSYETRNYLHVNQLQDSGRSRGAQLTFAQTLILISLYILTMQGGLWQSGLLDGCRTAIYLALDSSYIVVRHYGGMHMVLGTAQRVRIYTYPKGNVLPHGLLY